MADLEDRTVQDLTRAINENILALKKTSRADLESQKYYRRVIRDNITALEKQRTALIAEGKSVEDLTKKNNSCRVTAGRL